MNIQHLKVTFLCLVMFSIGLWVPATLWTQQKPFVEYPESTARYLARIQQGKREYAYRENWPGGVAAWQVAARRELAKKCGLTRIASEMEKHRPTVRLDKPVRMARGYQRIRGTIESEPGIQVPFFMLVPGRKGPYPLAICPHGHDKRGWFSYAGVYQDDQHKREVLAKGGNIAEQLVLQGYLSIAPATRGLARELSIQDPNDRHGRRECRAQLMHCLISGRTPVGERVWDLQKILDWALQRPDVDRKKVLMTGNSGGGVATAYAAALDTRIRLAIPSCSFTSITSSTGFIFHCDCCAIPSILDWGGMADVGGLIAPRSLLIVNGEKDSLHHRADVDRNTLKVRNIFAAARASEGFASAWGKEGHRFYPQIMMKFLDQQLPRLE